MRPSRDRSDPWPTGILIVRVWLEGDAPGQLRARLTQAADLNEAATTVVTTAERADICHAVEAWLEDFLRRGR
jgi:hypothetical protein